MSVGIDSSIGVVLEGAKLAELSYLSYNQGVLVKNNVFNVFESNGVVYSLDNKYQVIDYSDPSASGFNGVLLKNIDTGEYVVSFRGTKELIDWDSNLTTFLWNYNPQVQEGLAFVKTMMEAHQIDASKLTLTGHSLGGIIAQVVGAELRTQAYTYNSYGANLLSSLPSLGLPFYAVIGQIMDVLGLGDKNDPWVKDNILNVSFQDDGEINGDILSNWASEFTETLAGNDFLGGVLPVFGENPDSIIEGHSMSNMIKVIQGYSEKLQYFNSSVSMMDLSNVYILGGETTAYESIEKAFHKINLSNSEPDRLSLELFARLESDGFKSLNESDLVSLAESDIGYRYALVNLNIFAVTGSDSLYENHNSNGLLDLFNPETGEGQLTEEYLKDRAEMLKTLVQFNIEGKDYDDEVSLGGVFESPLKS